MKSITKLLIVLSIICMSVSCIRLERVITYGDTDSYEYLGMELAFVIPDASAESTDRITFPDVSKIEIKKNFCLIQKKEQWPKL